MRFLRKNAEGVASQKGKISDGRLLQIQARERTTGSGAKYALGNRAETARMTSGKRKQREHDSRKTSHGQGRPAAKEKAKDLLRLRRLTRVGADITKEKTREREKEEAGLGLQAQQRRCVDLQPNLTGAKSMGQYACEPN